MRGRLGIYARLIPLMENIPLWLHGIWTSASALYAITIVHLIAMRHVPYFQFFWPWLLKLPRTMAMPRCLAPKAMWLWIGSGDQVMKDSSWAS